MRDSNHMRDITHLYPRLKQAMKKSGQGAEGFSATDEWVWDKFQFIVPHIVDVKPRNIVSFKSKLNFATDPSTSDAAPMGSQSSSDAETDTPPAPPLHQVATAGKGPTVVTVSTRSSEDDTFAIGR